MRRDLDLRALIACGLAAFGGACTTTSDLGEACGEQSDDIEDATPFAPIALDLLVVIDDTPATQPFVEDFADALPVLVHALLTGDHDGDGAAETVAIDSLHVGVITGDLGGGPAPLPGCALGTGADARLRTVSSDVSCRGENPGGFLTLRRGARSELDALRCLARTSGEGCAISQPLEAALRAVTDDRLRSWDRDGAVPTRFLDGRGEEVAIGHACAPGEDCAHEGFVRPYAKHAVIVLSAGDDCSVADAAALDSEEPSLADVATPSRCAAAETLGLLRPIDRLADARVAWDLHVIAGVPSELRVAPLWGDPPEALLTDPRMASRLDPSGSRLAPSCTSREGHEASPPRRLAGAVIEARFVGAASSLQSICEHDARTQLLAIAAAWANDWGGQCLPPPLSPPPAMPDECVLYEDLPIDGGARCEDLAGRRSEGRYTDGFSRWERCRVDRVDGLADPRPGWFVDATVVCDPRSDPRAAFSRSFEATFWSSFALQCSRSEGLELRCDDDNDAARPCARGMLCTPGTSDRCSTGSSEGVALRCDPVARTCAIPCGSDEDCRAAGAPERVCDRRLVHEAGAFEAAWSEDTASEIRGVCVAPICER